MDAKSVAGQIQSTGMQIPGYRRDIRIIERVLNRYIPGLTILGGASVGFLASFADGKAFAANMGLAPEVIAKTFAEYNKRWPGEWGAVSWEYASILDLWRAGAEKAGSIEPTDVLPAMKAGGKGLHAFGEAEWWGKELFGIDNALVGDWPVVQIQNGKAKIVEFKSIPAWWEKNKDIMIKHFEALGEMWYQRS